MAKPMNESIKRCLIRYFRSWIEAFRRAERNRFRRRALMAETLETRQLLAGVPRLLSDIAPDVENSHPNSFTSFGGETFFIARSTELWKTDGTSSGTVLVKDLGPGVGDSYVSSLHNHNGTLVFTRTDLGSDGSFFARDDDRVELWKSDGTSGGTVRVKDFGLGSTSGYSDGSYFASVNGTLFTNIGTPSTGNELWKSDLTEAGTQLVRDINPGPGDSSPDQFLNHNGMLFFAANDGTRGRELWKSDGTSGGTVLVKDIDPIGSVGSYPGSYPNGFVVKDGNFFFGARTSGSDGIPFNEDDSGQLWKSDGTTAGTVRVKDFGPESSNTTTLLNVAGTIFGTAHTREHGAELWKSDGTESGTVLVKDINPSVGSYGPSGSYPRALTDVNGILFFVADDGVHGQELWKSDGTTDGTVLVKDVNPTVGAYSAYSSEISFVTELGGKLYFAANDGMHGQELWTSDGTSGGTVLVKDINPLSSAYGASGSQIYPLAAVNGLLFFGANDGIHGTEPWVLNPVVAFDFGDAPDSYRTLESNDGPRHAIGGSVFLGAEIDSEPDGQPSQRADGDDLDSNPDDEDGIVQTSRAIIGGQAGIDVIASADGFVDAWLDLNRNGVFDHPDEHIGAGTSVAVTAGSNVLSYPIPSDTQAGTTYARIRISAAGGLGPGGAASDGEVEDYQVAIRSSSSTSDWQNPANKFDSNGDKAVSPIDVLVIINFINAVGAGPLGDSIAVPSFWYDVNGDKSLSPIDPLQIINQINRPNQEGESIVPIVDAVSAPFFAIRPGYEIRHREQSETQRRVTLHREIARSTIPEKLNAHFRRESGRAERQAADAAIGETISQRRVALESYLEQDFSEIVPDVALVWFIKHR